jgi:hypothetical protein
VDDIVSGSNDALNFTILWWCVGTGHPQEGTVGEKKRLSGWVVELTTIITLDVLDGAAELCGYIGEKIWQSGECVKCQILIEEEKSTNNGKS